MYGKKRLTVLALALAALIVSEGHARMQYDRDDFKNDSRKKASFAPAHCIAAHRVGKLVLSVNNNGTFGDGFRAAPASDCFNGEGVPSCEYPKNSGSKYLFAGAFWIGAVVGRDTLVSFGADGWSGATEFFPDESPFGDMKHRSIKDPSSPLYEGAISEEDYISTYSDTITEGVANDYFGRAHRPLWIGVNEASYAWSYSYAEDFVLFDYKITNIGWQTLKDVYMGIYVDADVWGNGADPDAGAQDDVCGFLYQYPDTCANCEFVDTVYTAWIADNDGDFSGSGVGQPVPNVTATRIVRTPQDSLDVSFNWWISDTPALDFGPRRKDNYRDFRTGGRGTPEGDVNKYFILRNREFDYDQVRTAVIQPTDSVWEYPPQEQAPGFADGEDTRYTLSFGPFEINPGQTLPISFAYVGGENFHATGTVDNVRNLPDNPDAYYANLSFADLARNSKWASFVYDNPGVDTDGDGFFGRFHTCQTDSAIARIDTTHGEPPVVETLWTYTAAETCWYEGDGVPDFRGAAPPPAPKFWVESEVRGLKIRFNGMRSETTADRFSRTLDFEGYNIYIGRDLRPGALSLAESYDREDYNKWVQTDPAEDRWELLDEPFTLDELVRLYAFGDTTFSPLRYPRQHPYFHPYFDSVFYFTAQSHNVSRLGIDTDIRKRYPDQPYPSSLNPDSVAADELTDDGYFKYFEYEYDLSNLTPSLEWYVNVTAFDFGSPKTGLSPLESSPYNDADSAYALPDWETVSQKNLKVYVYPNPYRIDGNYRGEGFEGRNPAITPTPPPDRTRVLHFANLPPKCTIRLYTLDGDLLREINHDVDPNRAEATHEEWNLITRNHQLVVSGLYYWVVETPSGETQIGKLAVIM